MQKKNLPIILIIVATVIIGLFMLLNRGCEEDRQVDKDPNPPIVEDTVSKPQKGPHSGSDIGEEEEEKEEKDEGHVYEKKEDKPITKLSSNIDKAEGNIITWNKEIDADKIVINYSWKASPDFGEPLKDYSTSRTSNDSYNAVIISSGKFKFCSKPSSEDEMRMGSHTITVIITAYKNNEVIDTKSHLVPDSKDFPCGCKP